jgi:hypothetical protein
VAIEEVAVGRKWDEVDVVGAGEVDIVKDEMDADGVVEVETVEDEDACCTVEVSLVLWVLIEGGVLRGLFFPPFFKEKGRN